MMRYGVDAERLTLWLCLRGEVWNLRIQNRMVVLCSSVSCVWSRHQVSPVFGKRTRSGASVLDVGYINVTNQRYHPAGMYGSGQICVVALRWQMNYSVLSYAVNPEG
jgi:hypothetical protein